jgi:cation transport regulator ChaC
MRFFPNESVLWYFAYGSNMNSAVFQVRRGMRPTHTERATLRDYALVFNQPGTPWIEPSFANIEYSPGSVIEGVLYRITNDEMRLLDISEGNGAYDIVSAPVHADSLGEVHAYTFLTHNVAHGLHPSQRYMNLLVNGAVEHGLSREWVQKLREAPFHDHPIARRIAPCIRAFNNVCTTIGLPHPFRWWRERVVRAAKRARERGGQN